MPKILTTNIRVGDLLDWDSHLWKVIKCHHVHVGGRGGAYMQVEMKDIERGTKMSHRFNTDDKVEKAFVESREMNFLYKEGDNYIFMDLASFEQFTITVEFLDEQVNYLIPNTVVSVSFYSNNPIGVELPQHTYLKVITAAPMVKGATASSSYKPVITETGLTVSVPPFIVEGDVIKINTDSGQYLERM